MNVLLRPAAAAGFAYTVVETTMRRHAVATWGAWDEPGARERTAADAAGGRSRVVVCDGVDAGWLCSETATDHLHVDQLFILPPWQRRGVGSEVLKRLVAEAAGLPLRLRVLRTNVDARRFYERHGFAVTSTTPERWFMQRAGMSAAVAAFWQRWVATTGVDRTSDFHEAFHFMDDEGGARELADLVLAGIKRATASLVWSFEHDGQPQPRPGKVSVVTDWHGAPLCVIETTQVDVVAFDDVSAEFAAIENEGDGSLAYWRDAHAGFFARECARIGRDPSPRMPVVCERFRVVWQP